MSKNKKKQKKQESIAQSVVALTANGLKAFRQGDFEKAIVTWEKEPVKLRPATLLAEAHFRRGLALFYGSETQTGLIHLQTARGYQPDDPGYAYHVGLALHHLGDVSGALTAYQTVRQTTGPFATRAAYPQALALLQNGQDPTTTPAWNGLIVTEQAMLRSANVFRRRPYNLPLEAPLLWRALISLDRDDLTQARAGLEQVLAGEATLAEKAVTHYYQGVLAARTEDWETARRAWEAAFAAGLRSARLHSNLAEIYLRRAEDLLTQGDANTAFAAVEEARRHNPGDNALNELSAQIHQQLGFEAAAANRWDEAQSHWQAAVELDSGSFRLAYNLALAYEKSDDHLLAGQTWREALRRRPRRADHPDALSDEQVAQVWQRAAECYRKAGEFDEVGRTYQQAIKWAPENLNLRLALAESLMMDGRLQAARNELERVLERDPKNIPALLRLGEACFRDEGSPWYVKAQAKQYWEKALQIEPKNSQARQLMGEWYMNRGEIAFSWDRYAEAAENYRKALEFHPNHIETLVYLAECAINLKEDVKADDFARQALAHAIAFDDFARIIDRWVCIGDDKRAWEATAQTEARLSTIPTDFYVSTGCHALKHKRKEQARRWLERAIQKAAPEDNVLVMIGEMAMDVDPPLAMEYLQKALDSGQEPGQAHLLMGILEDQQDNQRAAKKHFSEAERIARQTKNAELVRRVEAARIMLGGTASMMRRLMDIGGPGLLEEFMNEFGEEFDDD